MRHQASRTHQENVQIFLKRPGALAAAGAPPLEQFKEVWALVVGLAPEPMPAFRRGSGALFRHFSGTIRGSCVSPALFQRASSLVLVRFPCGFGADLRSSTKELQQHTMDFHVLVVGRRSGPQEREARLWMIVDICHQCCSALIDSGRRPHRCRGSGLGCLRKYSH